MYSIPHAEPCLGNSAIRDHKHVALWLASENHRLSYSMLKPEDERISAIVLGSSIEVGCEFPAQFTCSQFRIVFTQKVVFGATRDHVVDRLPMGQDDVRIN